jgi:hypothetical protein
MKIPGPECGYVDLLDDHTLTKTEKEASEQRAYTPLRPSAAGKCSRELAYEFMEYRGKAHYPKEPMMPDTVRLLNLGHSVEWNLLKQFEEVELFKTRYRQQVVSFFKITEEEWCEGSIDLCFWSDKWKCVGDIKSKKDKFSSWAATNWDETTEKLKTMSSVQTITDKAFWVEDLAAFLIELNDPFFAANFYQLNMYASSQFLQERGIDHAVIIQYNKNDSRIREVRFKPSAEVYEQVKEKFFAVRDAIDKDGNPELAPKDYVLGSIKCAFCNFKKTCWGDDDALKAYFATWPKKVWPTKSTELSREDYSHVELLIEKFKDAEKASGLTDALERDIVKFLNDNKIEKIKFDDGSIYQLKALKSGLVIRRTKS